MFGLQCKAPSMLQGDSHVDIAVQELKLSDRCKVTTLFTCIHTSIDYDNLLYFRKQQPFNLKQDELKRFVRFWSSKSGDNQTSLDEYISRMKADLH